MNAANHPTEYGEGNPGERDFALREEAVANPPAHHECVRLEAQVLEELIAPGLSTVPGLLGNHNEVVLADDTVLAAQLLEEVIAPAGVIID